MERELIFIKAKTKQTNLISIGAVASDRDNGAVAWQRLGNFDGGNEVETRRGAEKQALVLKDFKHLLRQKRPQNIRKEAHKHKSNVSPFESFVRRRC